MARDIGATPAHKRTEVTHKTELRKERSKSAPQCREELMIPKASCLHRLLLKQCVSLTHHHRSMKMSTGPTATRREIWTLCAHSSLRRPAGNEVYLSSTWSPVADHRREQLDLRTSSDSEKAHLPHQAQATYILFTKVRVQIFALHAHLITFRGSHMINLVISAKAIAMKPRTAISQTEITEVPSSPRTRKTHLEPTNLYN